MPPILAGAVNVIDGVTTIFDLRDSFTELGRKGPLRAEQRGVDYVIYVRDEEKEKNFFHNFGARGKHKECAIKVIARSILTYFSKLGLKENIATNLVKEVLEPVLPGYNAGNSPSVESAKLSELAEMTGKYKEVAEMLVSIASDCQVSSGENSSRSLEDIMGNSTRSKIMYFTDLATLEKKSTPEKPPTLKNKYLSFSSEKSVATTEENKQSKADSQVEKNVRFSGEEYRQGSETREWWAHQNPPDEDGYITEGEEIDQ